MAASKQLSPTRYHRFSTGCAFGMTDVGRVRTSNEDNFLIDEALGLVAVCDGMGGHDAGEVASAEALVNLQAHLAASIEKLASRRPVAVSAPHDPDATHPGPRGQALDPDATIALVSLGASEPDPDATSPNAVLPAVAIAYEAVEQANRRIFEMNQANLRPDGGGMGTTLTGFWRHGPNAPLVLFHVGDSRMYRYRAGKLLQLTHDQTLYQQAIDFGATTNLPARNLLLQAIGPSEIVEPEIKALSVNPDDVYLLCSDGLHSATSPEEIERVLASATPENLEQCCEELIVIANESGGTDNVTVVIAAFFR